MDRVVLPVKGSEQPSLITIPNVPIVSTGTYHLGVNPYGDETTFTEEDLADAVGAVEDPAVLLPRLKLGHTSEWGDAEPCFGKVSNLRVEDNGQTVYGDFVGVPSWLADVLPTAYPNRSIEAMFNVETPTGRNYRMVLTAVALLGVVLPGVATLEDLTGLYTETQPEIEIEAGQPVMATIGGEDDMTTKKKEARGSINLEDVRRAYYEGLNAEQSWWWIRAVYLDPDELIVDDDTGSLYRVGFTVKGEEVEFDDPVEVKVQYVNAGSKQAHRLELDAAQTVFASRSESRPETTEEEDSMDGKTIRERLGLPEDASDDDVYAKLGELNPESPETPEEGAGTETEEETSEEGGEESPSGEERQPASTTASDGTVRIDAEQLRQLQENASLGRQAHDARAKESRDAVLAKAIEDGKLPPSRKEHYERLFERDPEGTQHLLTASVDDGGLAPNTVPVTEAGGVPGESETTVQYDESWLSPGERQRLNAAREGRSTNGRITQEVS